MIPQAHLKAGRERSVLRHHPWIFGGAVAQLPDGIQNGQVVEVNDATGDFLCYGAYSQYSKIVLRNLTYSQERFPDQSWIMESVQRAVALRLAAGIANRTNAWRVVFGEADGLPGVIADLYGDLIVLQLSTAWADVNKQVIAESCLTACGARSVYERSDADVRQLEGLVEQNGLLAGDIPQGEFLLTEYDRVFRVDLLSGQKSGFYLDQRANREMLKRYAAGRRVLNCFSYTGGFTVAALQGGASEVISVDISEPAVNQAQENVRLNQLPEERSTVICADAFAFLRLQRDKGEKYDLIVLDPPKFAPTIAQVDKASRGYKDINLLALKLLNPGGMLFTFSCSGGVDAPLFQKIVADAALDAKAEVSILESLRQDVDHPVLLSFPESSYLKGLVCFKK